LDQGDGHGSDKDKQGAGDAAGGILLMPLGAAWTAAGWVRLREMRRRTRGWLRGRHPAR
jgi:hypothetical protein